MANDLSDWQAWLTDIERKYDQAVEEHLAAEALAERMGDGDGRAAAPGWQRAAETERIARDHAIMAYTRYKAALVAYCARTDNEARLAAREREDFAVAA